MITKETARIIDSELLIVNSPSTSAIEQFEALLRIGLIISRATISLIDFTQNHWDNAGSGSGIQSTPNGVAPVGGQYDAAYLRKIQLMYLSYKRWLATPVSLEIGGNTITLSETPRQLMMTAPFVAPQYTPAVQVDE